MDTQQIKWLDRYWTLVDAGCSSHDALAKVCVEFGLSSYDEAWLEEIRKVND